MTHGTVLGFTITCHTPFRVGAAYARDGVDAAVDRDDPLPADHLKGVMRAAADELFGRTQHPVVQEVFGSRRAPTPWSWSSAQPSDHSDWVFSCRHRVAIDAKTHSAKKDHLVLGEQAWTHQARFTISRVGIMPGQPGSALTEADHILILRCAAAGVHGLGAWRRRGLGWVGITPDTPITAEDVGALHALAHHAEAAE